MTTTLVENELLTEVQLPMLPNNSRFGFEEFSRRAGLRFDHGIGCLGRRGGKDFKCRIGLGGVEDRPRRIIEAEEILNEISRQMMFFEEQLRQRRASLIRWRTMRHRPAVNGIYKGTDQTGDGKAGK